MSNQYCHLFLSRTNCTNYEIAKKIRNSQGFLLFVSSIWDILILSPNQLDSNEIERLISYHTYAVLVVREDASRLKVQLFKSGQSNLEVDLEESDMQTIQTVEDFKNEWNEVVTQMYSDDHLSRQILTQVIKETVRFSHLTDVTNFMYKLLEAESYIETDFMQLQRLKNGDLCIINALKVGHKESSYFKRTILEHYKNKMGKHKFKHDKSASISDEIHFVNNELDYPKSITFKYLGYKSRTLYIYSEVATSYDCITEDSAFNAYDLMFCDEESLTALLELLESHIFDEVIPKLDMRMPKPFSLQQFYLTKVDPIFEKYDFKRLESIPNKISGTRILYTNPYLGLNFVITHNKIYYRMAFRVEQGGVSEFLSDWLKINGIDDNISEFASFEGLDTYEEQVMMRVSVLEEKVFPILGLKP